MNKNIHLASAVRTISCTLGLKSSRKPAPRLVFERIRTKPFTLFRGDNKALHLSRQDSSPWLDKGIHFDGQIDAPWRCGHALCLPKSLIFQGAMLSVGWFVGFFLYKAI